jgi:small-conductance mechanosensitive channel
MVLPRWFPTLLTFSIISLAQSSRAQRQMELAFKIIGVLALIYLAVVLSATIGAFVAMFLKLTLHLNPSIIIFVALYLPKLLLLIGALLAYVVYKRKSQKRRQQHQISSDSL